MKTQSIFNNFPYGFPTGSLYPYNSLADTIDIVNIQTPLWQRRSSIFARLAARIKKLYTLINRARRAQMDSATAKGLTNDLAKAGQLE